MTGRLGRTASPRRAPAFRVAGAAHQDEHHPASARGRTR